MLREYSIRVRNRTVRIRLEDEFWDCLRDNAADKDMTLPRLVQEIAGMLEGDQDGCTLASALRVYVLEQVMEEAKFLDRVK